MHYWVVSRVAVRYSRDVRTQLHRSTGTQVYNLDNKRCSANNSIFCWFESPKVLDRIAPNCTVLYCTIPYNTVPYRTIANRTAPSLCHGCGQRSVYSNAGAWLLRTGMLSAHCVCAVRTSHCYSTPLHCISQEKLILFCWRKSKYFSPPHVLYSKIKLLNTILDQKKIFKKLRASNNNNSLWLNEMKLNQIKSYEIKLNEFKSKWKWNAPLIKSKIEYFCCNKNR